MSNKHLRTSSLFELFTRKQSKSPIQARSPQQLVELPNITIEEILNKLKNEQCTKEIINNVQSFKLIKDNIKDLWQKKIISHQELLQLYELLYQMKQNDELKGKIRLLQCYIPNEIININIIECLQTCDIQKFIQTFQKHLLYNYVHTIQIVQKYRPQVLQDFLPQGNLFNNFQPNDEGQLSKSNQLLNLSFLASDQVQQIKVNYNNIAYSLLNKLYGQIRDPLQDQNSFLYNLLIYEGQTKLNFKEFQNEQDKIYILLKHSNNIQKIIQQLHSFYKQNQLNFFEEMILQFHKTSKPSKLFNVIVEFATDFSAFEIYEFIEASFQSIQQCSSENNKEYLDLSKNYQNVLHLFDKQSFEGISDKIGCLNQAYDISCILNQFYINFKLSTITTIILSPNELLKCLDQLLENYHVNRVVSQQLKYKDKIYNLQTDLKNLLLNGFKISEINLDQLLFRKLLDFGKYREAKQMCQQFQLEVCDFDNAITEAMNRYLQLQKKIEYIEDERKKFLEIVNEVKRITKNDLPNASKTMSLYKFIIESKEIGIFTQLDLSKCNQVIFQIYRRSQNLDLPYIRLKKKLSKANGVEIYDRNFCKFMIDLAKKNFTINQHKAQFILEDLQKNGDEYIQSEASVLLLQFSKDETSKQQQYLKVLKQAQSAETIQTLLNLQKPNELGDLIPYKLGIYSKEIIDVPLDNSVQVAKFEQEYRKYYQNDIKIVVFLDMLLKEPKQAFNLLSKQQPQSYQRLIIKLVQSPMLNSEKILTQYLQIFVNQIDINQLLQSNDQMINELCQALILSKHKQIFDKNAYFDKNMRLKQIYDRMEQLDLENIIPELKYFKDIDFKEIKLQIFQNKIKQTNLKDYYINNNNEHLKSYVRNQIKQNPYLIEISIDLRYHFIIYQEIYGFTEKEKHLIHSFINQCILGEQRKLQNYDNIYKQIIKKEYDYSIIEQDFELIINNENIFIISEIAKYYYNEYQKIMELYFKKLIKNNEDINLWLTSPDATILKNIMNQVSQQY